MALKDCENCLVYGTDNRPLAKARVEMIDEKHVWLFFQYSKLRSIRIKTFVDFYDGQYGVVRSHCELVIQKSSHPNRNKEPWMASCTILNVQDTFQRQKDLRVRVSLRAEFNTVKGTYFSGTIENISAGGLFLVTPQVLKKNEHFTFRYRFSGDVYELEARVLRIGTLIKGEYSYGCQFANLTMEAEAAVRKYVFAKQKEKLSKQAKRVL
ncbi:MAG: PilZ domain-containing protein [Lachnospiraceae bacterium]|jgi:hypothetical protein|nr:PilZ domain-containing protein [Lachnospiraceae bacterium]